MCTKASKKDEDLDVEAVGVRCGLGLTLNRARGIVWECMVTLGILPDWKVRLIGTL
jgi:hypothetical protein